MNKLMIAYWNLYNTMTMANEEDGAEAIEWIAMVAVILILLLAAEPVFKRGGDSLATTIIDQIDKWIKKFV